MINSTCLGVNSATIAAASHHGFAHLVDLFISTCVTIFFWALGTAIFLVLMYTLIRVANCLVRFPEIDTTPRVTKLIPFTDPKTKEKFVLVEITQCVLNTNTSLDQIDV